jgi:DNA mismatch repair protein MutS
MQEAATPLMRQYHAIKQQVPQALLFFRLGDFYELFFEDAVTAARELGITLTSRNKEKEQAVPMCGVPFHAAEGYIARLIRKGYRVAICDQMEDPKQAKKLVRREVTRIITPGATTERNVLDEKQNNFLAAVFVRESRAGVAIVDVSTGEFRCLEAPMEEVAALLDTWQVKEVLLTERTPPLPGVRTVLEDWIFERDYCERTLRDQYKLLSLDGIGLDAHPLAISAAGAVVHYLRDTQRAALDHVDRPLWLETSANMMLDAVTVRNLELIEPIFSADLGGGKLATLLGIVDETKTGMGARLLRQRLIRPFLQRSEAEQRHDTVQALRQQMIPRIQLREVLGKVSDLERLSARITMNTATPRELQSLGASLSLMPLLQQHVAAAQAVWLLTLLQSLPDLAPLCEQIANAIADQPPVNLSDGGTIRPGFHAGLDELRDIQANGRRYILDMEARERQRTGIASLKIRFNNVFGYYIEISRANLANAPSDYERKQTLVNAERYTTPELKELERRILEAEERILEIEKEIFQEVRSAAAACAPSIRMVSRAIAEVDVNASFAHLAAERAWNRPRFSDAGRIRVVEGRHPVVERLVEQEAQRFIPNDIWLDREKFVALVTGPNMGGKSTWLRQTALLCILAQCGSFVPAREAELPLIDRVYTRIGAADNVARGRSTFMVEMTETALILNTATERSLVIMDEIGRGTSTYDGLALAWAVLEHLHTNVRALTLFATHYHELTALETSMTGLRNLHVSVQESGGQVIFLRRVEPGAANKSYGIEVARLAALPLSVVERAKQILALHENSETRHTRELRPTTPAPSVQVRLFEPVNQDLADRIRSLKLDELRPIEALKLLEELQRELG